MADPEPGCLAGSRNGRLESGHLLLSQEAWSKKVFIQSAAATCMPESCLFSCNN